jgi:hypothetical protein
MLQQLRSCILELQCGHGGVQVMLELVLNPFEIAGHLSHAVVGYRRGTDALTSSDVHEQLLLSPCLCFDAGEASGQLFDGVRKNALRLFDFGAGSRELRLEFSCTSLESLANTQVQRVRLSTYG